MVRAVGRSGHSADHSIPVSLRSGGRRWHVPEPQAMGVVNNRYGRPSIKCLAARSVTRRVNVFCQGFQPLVLSPSVLILFGPLSPALDIGDERLSFGGEGWGEGSRQNAVGTTKTS